MRLVMRSDNLFAYQNLIVFQCPPKITPGFSKKKKEKKTIFSALVICAFIKPIEQIISFLLMAGTQSIIPRKTLHTVKVFSLVHF